MARRKLPYVPVSAAFIFLASHLVEFVFACTSIVLFRRIWSPSRASRLMCDGVGPPISHFSARFYLLRCIGIKPAPVPNWAKFFGPDLLSLQPSTFDTASSDMIILDRRARERLGYEPIWETAQTIKWCTDVVESTKNFGPIGMFNLHCNQEADACCAKGLNFAVIAQAIGAKTRALLLRGAPKFGMIRLRLSDRNFRRIRNLIDPPSSREFV